MGKKWKSNIAFVICGKVCLRPKYNSANELILTKCLFSYIESFTFVMF